MPTNATERIYFIWQIWRAEIMLYVITSL